MSRGADPRLLHRRAVSLARPAVEDDRTPTIDLLVTTVDGRRIGFDSAQVVQILPNRRGCRLPAECGELLGLIASRGALVPVADLGSLIGGTPPNPQRQFIVLVEGDAPALGLLVDDVTSVTSVPVHTVRAPTAAASGPSLERGITFDGVVVLDTDRVLRDPRLNPRSGHDHATLPSTPRPPTTPGEPCLT